MARRFSTDLDRRSYLRVVGVGGLAGMAGCIDSLTGGGGGEGLIAGTASGFAPFEIREDGELVGFDIDLLEAVIDETDYTLDSWEDLNSFESLIPALTNGNIDVIAAAMTINPTRDETIDFSDPYYSADQSVVVRAGGSFQPTSLEDLSGRNVGAQRGTTGEGVAQDAVSESNYNGYDQYTFAIQDLENGNIDAVVIDKPVGEAFAASRDVEVAFTVPTGENYGFGVRTDDDDLQSALNDGIQAVRDSGRYQEITQKWFGQ